MLRVETVGHAEGEPVLRSALAVSSYVAKTTSTNGRTLHWRSGRAQALLHRQDQLAAKLMGDARTWRGSCWMRARSRRRKEQLQGLAGGI